MLIFDLGWQNKYEKLNMLESTLSHINYTYITMASKIHLVHWCYPLKKLVRPNLPAGVEGVGGGGERGWKEATKSSVTKDLSSRVVSTHICIRYGCIQIPLTLPNFFHTSLSTCPWPFSLQHREYLWKCFLSCLSFWIACWTYCSNGQGKGRMESKSYIKHLASTWRSSSTW